MNLGTNIHSYLYLVFIYEEVFNLDNMKVNDALSVCCEPSIGFSYLKWSSVILLSSFDKYLSLHMIRSAYAFKRGGGHLCRCGIILMKEPSTFLCI